MNQLNSFKVIARVSPLRAAIKTLNYIVLMTYHMDRLNDSVLLKSFIKMLLSCDKEKFDIVNIVFSLMTQYDLNDNA